ncbi:MAG: polyprenyl synthetase family protein [bacterium]
MNKWQKRIEAQLERYLPPISQSPNKLHEAMRYSVLGGGKRIRAQFVYASGIACGAQVEQLDASAAAVEIIHAYSLIHDDLPAMDDDDLRRNKPTCHIAFDEATAILAGDALQALAFQLLCENDLINAEQRCQMTQNLAIACGSLGMAGGQALDLDAVGIKLDEAALSQMHKLKTGALIHSSIRLGYLTANPQQPQLIEALDQYATALGLAFQVHDDILDVSGTTETLGKPARSDIDMNKPTYPSILGLEKSKQLADKLFQQALHAIDNIADNEMLIELARLTVQRSH